MAVGRRFLFFTNECVGLGHLRRAITLARGVTDDDEAATALIVTGSAAASTYRLPPRVDTVKLPLLARDDRGRHRAGQLAVPLGDASALRSRMAVAAVEAFAPDVAVVDKTPLGLGGELVAALEALREQSVAVVLGLRDVEDAPETVRRRWAEGRLLEALERYYDAVLVYGKGTGEDALACLGRDGDVRLPVHRVGYVGVPVPRPSGRDGGYVLATAGGGVDGERLLSTFVDALRARPLDVPAVLVTGPLMAPRAVARLRARAEGLDISVLEFAAEMESLIAGARAVVAMAGYNTVSEIVRAATPAVLVPRVKPSREQLVRASALADSGAVRMLHPDDLDARALRRVLDDLLAAPRAVAPARDEDGLPRAVEILRSLADEPAAACATPAAAAGGLL